VQFQRAFIEDVAVTAGAFVREERHSENFTG
jgi:hypothetical protein